MENKVLIVGATSDVAKALCHKYVEQGAEVILAGRNVERLNPFVQDTKCRFDKEVALLELDVNDFSSHEAFSKLSILQDIDLVVCVFGYLGDQATAESSWDEAYNIMSTNYLGVVSLLNLFAKYFVSKKQGGIIGVSSVAGERGRQSNFMYGSAKAAVTAYLAGLRNKLHHEGLHVMTVIPGFMDTRMTKDLDLPKSITSSPDNAANQIYRAYRKKKNTIYVSSVWRWIMLIIRNIPEPIFKKLKM